MKISQKLLCITVLIATMTLGISVAAGFRFASALVSSVVRAGNVASRAIPAAEIPASTNESAELIFESPTSMETNTDRGANDEILDYSGEYYLGSEEVPKPFADLDYLDLTTHEHNDVNRGECRPCHSTKGIGPHNDDIKVLANSYRWSRNILSDRNG